MELISREEVMRLVENGKLLSGSFGERARDIIEAIPTIEEREEGRWIPHAKTHDVCSVCGTGTQVRFFGIDELGIMSETIYKYDYCPHCGARMKGE